MSLIDEAQNEVLKALTTSINQIGDKVDDIDKRRIGATVWSVQTTILSELPTPTPTKIGWVRYVTDGYRMGEISPSGCFVYCNGTSWLRVNDDGDPSSASGSQLPKVTLANLPTANAAREGQTIFVTNGRKSGEGVGNGTGVLVICADDGASTYRWLVTSSYSEVQA